MEKNEIISKICEIEGYKSLTPYSTRKKGIFVSDDGDTVILSTSTSFQKKQGNFSEPINSMDVWDFVTSNPVGWYYYVFCYMGETYFYKTKLFNLISNRSKDNPTKDERRYLCLVKVEDAVAGKKKMRVNGANRTLVTLFEMDKVGNASDCTVDSIKDEEPNETSNTNIAHVQKCIYILTNKSFKDDWIKIGYTDRAMTVRSKELDNTSCPLPFDIYATLETPYPKEAESLIHEMIDNLTDARIRPNREFFNIKPEKAYSIFMSVKKCLDKYGKNVLTRYENNVPALEKKR